MDNEPKTLARIILDRGPLVTTAMGLQKPLIDDLDLMALPERLDDETLERVKDISRSPLPPPEPSDERHFSQCLRIMLAVLPKRSSDEISGELFVAAYRKKLAHYSNQAISHLADKAMGECQWFPTISECLDLIKGYYRNDEHTQRRSLALQMLNHERDARYADKVAQRESIGATPDRVLTQTDVDVMSPEMIRIGLGCQALRKDDDGAVRPWFHKPGEPWDFQG